MTTSTALDRAGLALGINTARLFQRTSFNTLRRGAHNDLSKDRRLVFAWLRREGYSWKEIGRLCGVAHSSVITSMQRHAAELDLLDHQRSRINP